MHKPDEYVSVDEERLRKSALAVLSANDLGASTKPAPRLYPHQWLWDSCFVAIGLRHSSPARAQREIDSIFRGQWQNGMLPHIIFSSHSDYHAGPDMWHSRQYAEAPEDIATSCITQPPMIAEAMVLVGSKLSRNERISFFEQHIDGLIKYHEWLYRERDPHNTGLVTLLHAWECGIEDTPYWSEAMKTAAPPKVRQAIAAGSFASLDALRPDLSHASLEERPSSADYYTLYHTFELLRSADFSLSEAGESTNVPLIQDVFFNAILVRANKHLRDIAKAINRTLPVSLLKCMAHAEKAFANCYGTESSERAGGFVGRDFRTGKMLNEPSIANLMGLYAGVLPTDQTDVLIDKLTSKEYWPHFGVATTPVSSPYYSELRFWQGPVWINTNWLLVQGLRQNGRQDVADMLCRTTLDLVSKDWEGMHEYYSAQKGAPAGTVSFSWTAALVLDLLAE